MEQSQSLDTLQSLIEKATKAGATAADAIYAQGDALSIQYRNGKLEQLERAEGNDIGLRVFVGKRQAVVSSSDFSESGLTDLAARAVSMAKVVPEDMFCGLADSGQIVETFVDVDSFDPLVPTEAQLIEAVKECEQSGLAVQGITGSEGASASWGTSYVTLLASNGFVGKRRGSSWSLSTALIAGKGTGMEQDYDFSSAVYGQDLESASLLGKRAGEKTVKHLNPRRIPTTRAPVVFDPAVSSTLLGSFAAAINGAAIAKGTSFLRDAMGKPIFHEAIQIIDDPHRKKGMRSKGFDAEGIGTEKRTIIKDGVLQSWILDLRSARQLKLKTTGNASRGPSSVPSPSVSNLYMNPGKIKPSDLIKSLDKALYVTDLMGHGVNGITGDYSQGMRGYWIEKGEIAFPVSELTIAGNLKEMFATMLPCNDLSFRYGIDAPTVLIENMMIAGE